MVKYYTETWNNKITPVEVEKENDLSVWINGRASRKQTVDAGFYDTWEEAHDFLLVRATRAVESARYQYEKAKDKLGNVKGMKKP